MCQVCWNGVWNSKSSPRLYCGTAWNFFDVVGCPTWTVYSQLGAKSPLHSVSFYKKRFEVFTTYRSLYFPFFHLLGSLAFHGCFLKFSSFSQWFLKFCKKPNFFLNHNFGFFITHFDTPIVFDLISWRPLEWLHNIST